ncbi:MAG: hypothetical protein ACI3VA_08040 [Candidatus Limivicinus sp.]
MKSLYEYYWRRGGIGEMDHGWESFDDFVKWCSLNGYQKNYHLKRLDPTKPHGPGNSFWDRTEDKRAMDKVDAKAPEENPCGTCKNDPYCNSICPLRAAWWDVKMQEVRRALGAERT